MTTQYLLDKAIYAEWFRRQFQEPAPSEMMDANTFFVLEVEGISKLSTDQEEVVYVHAVGGSIGVSLGLSFTVAKRCLNVRRA